MTLYRQLLIFVITLLCLLFAGMWGEKLSSTRNFLLNQMESHAQDTATSLGLSLSTFYSEMDTPAMETMINAVFDRGYYREISLSDMEQRAIVARRLDVKVEGVPPWFIRMVPLTSPKAEALIMNQWQRAGTVTVESHPGFAYGTLWETTLSTSLWFAAAIIGAAILGGIGLHYLLRPLTRVEEQALGLCERQYQLQEQIPRTRELARVVRAMNTMTAKVQAMFREQADAAELLFQQTYLDPLTGLGNRRFIEGQVLTKVTEKTAPLQGAFVIIHLKGLQSINDTLGYAAGDRLLEELAGTIRAACEQYPAAGARLGGSDFAILLANSDREQAEAILAMILEQSREGSLAGGLQTEVPVTAGGLIYESNLSFSRLLKGADEALRSAIHSGSNQALLSDSLGRQGALAKGRSQWKELLEEVISGREIRLFVQKTVQPRLLAEAVHFEVLTRIEDRQQNILPAGLFIPLAERYQLITRLDRLVLEKILELPRSLFQPSRLALNISPTSLDDDRFYHWLVDTLRSLPADGPRFNFEFAEIRAVRSTTRIGQFIGDLQGSGHQVGIDHFGQGLIHFGYLQSLMPDYIKIDRAITHNIDADNRDNVFFIRSICNAAHSLDIRVIVEGIEREEQLQALRSIALDGVQGYHIHRPRAIPLETV
ncbi:EAL domain-containing protein [Desulfogranum mediterraneum]|uniref:EAL domain-containing protein n=1 Tax=Desulfogranum mediterraneum TaxID=160661 RepID=UPI000412341F|nr:EAL domain-containing protein [Desulfogranum mediterraneum]